MVPVYYVSQNLDLGQETDGRVMDFSKAIDKVSHSLLKHKLDHYGITVKTNIGSEISLESGNKL